jgi:predicted RNA-binding Zn-ribbon protein involved in translation (DUF1610 family)
MPPNRLAAMNSNNLSNGPPVSPFTYAAGMAEGKTDLCLGCGAELDGEPPGQTVPCPTCGATSRSKHGSARLTTVGSGRAQGYAIYAWDSNSLTLAGVIFGIVVTVLGVIIAPHGIMPALVYAAIALALLAAGLFLFAQRIIGAMRWLLKRGMTPKRRPS